MPCAHFGTPHPPWVALSWGVVPPRMQAPNFDTWSLWPQTPQTRGSALHRLLKAALLHPARAAYRVTRLVVSLKSEGRKPATCDTWSSTAHKPSARAVIGRANR